MQVGGDSSQVIDDDNGDSHVVGKPSEQSGVSVEAASGATHTNDGEVLCRTLSCHRSRVIKRRLW